MISEALCDCYYFVIKLLFNGNTIRSLIKLVNHFCSDGSLKYDSQRFSMREREDRRWVSYSLTQKQWCCVLLEEVACYWKTVCVDTFLWLLPNIGECSWVCESSKRENCEQFERLVMFYPVDLMESTLSHVFLFVRETRPHYVPWTWHCPHTGLCSKSDEDHSCLTQTLFCTSFLDAIQVITYLYE